ncbi:MAG: pyruvate, water dikinase regulatory protein [Acetobacteraceae bacterium]
MTHVIESAIGGAVRAGLDSGPDGAAPGHPTNTLVGAPRPERRLVNLHLVSDATGETLNAIARATVVQFEHADIVCHRWSLIRSRFQLHRVIEGIEADPGPVLSTLVERALRAQLETDCRRLGLPIVNVLDPVLGMLADQAGEQAGTRPGRQYRLDDAYFRRIDAMHYVLAHDDGQAAAGILEADVVLVGVSRSSKTPTSFYLANHGVKAANVPLVPNLPLPEALSSAECPVIGLTVETERLIEIRRQRLRAIAAQDQAIAAHAQSGAYVDHEAVAAELLWARRLCTRHGWPMIDVTRRSIEETAAAVLQRIELWHRRREGRLPAAAGKPEKAEPDAPAA